MIACLAPCRFALFRQPGYRNHRLFWPSTVWSWLAAVERVSTFLLLKAILKIMQTFHSNAPREARPDFYSDAPTPLTLGFPNEDPATCRRNMRCLTWLAWWNDACFTRFSFSFSSCARIVPFLCCSALGFGDRVPAEAGEMCCSLPCRFLFPTEKFWLERRVERDRKNQVSSPFALNSEAWQRLLF